jgi:hypothetical protein
MASDTNIYLYSVVPDRTTDIVLHLTTITSSDSKPMKYWDGVAWQLVTSVNLITA